MATLKENETVQREQNTTPETKVDVSQNQEIAEAVVTSENELATHSVEASTKIETQALAQQTITENEQRETKVLEQHMQAEENTLAKWTKAETQTLQEEIENTPKAISDREIAKIKDNETLKLVADERIKKCKALRSGIRSREWNGESKNWLKQEISWAITNMESMVSDINRLKKKWVVYSNLDVDKNRIWEIIYNYYTNREPARQMISLWMKVPHINSFVDSKKDAKRLARHEKRNQEYQQRMAELLKDPMLLHLLWDDQSALNQYYKDVISWYVEPSTHPFYTRHMQSFLLMERVEPELYWALAPKNRLWQITYNTYCQRNPAMYEAYCRDNNIVCRPKSFNNKFWDRFANMMEQIFPNRMGNDPRQRQAWSNIWSLLAIWWTIFMWFKALQSLKKGSDWKRNWWWFAWWTAWTLALLNADTVINTIQDAFNWHPAEKSKMMAESFRTYWFSDAQAMEMADRYVWAPVATMSALHFIPIYELESQHILEDKNGEFEFNYNNYENYINKFAWDKDQKDQVLKAWKKLDNDKSVWTWLKAFWIATRDKLRSLFWSEKKRTLADTDEVKEWWGKMIEKVQHGVNKELYNHGLRVKNPEDVDLIMQEYDKEKDKIGANKLILKWMKEWLLEFSEDKPYTLNGMLENNDIDLENMTMRWFKYSEWANEVKFSSYGELFDTYFLTKKIMYKFEWVPAKSNEPFKINTLWQLKFDDKNWYEFFNGDTTVITRKTFTDDFPTLKENRDDYARYLNKRRQGKNGVDESQFDIVSKLWINFYSEKEARDLNKILNKIKSDLRYYYPTKYWDPFEIKDGVLKIKIEFTTVWESKKTWNISWFKTFSNEANKEKLLKYLNDKTNKMWWSSL